tara:strand:+ start:3841 stop:4266 length:426 start_codon:yes stop_codon:yes gene_type:complete
MSISDNEEPIINDEPELPEPPKDSILKPKIDNRKGKQRSPAQIAAFEKMKAANAMKKIERTRLKKELSTTPIQQQQQQKAPVLKRSKQATVVNNYYYGNQQAPTAIQQQPTPSPSPAYQDSSSEYESSSEEENPLPQVYFG